MPIAILIPFAVHKFLLLACGGESRHPRYERPQHKYWAQPLSAITRSHARPGDTTSTIIEQLGETVIPGLAGQHPQECLLKSHKEGNGEEIGLTSRLRASQSFFDASLKVFLIRWMMHVCTVVIGHTL